MQQNIITEFNPDKLIQNKEEFKRFLSVIDVMEHYSSKELAIINKMEKSFENLDQKYISKLSFNYKERISKLKKCILENQELLNDIIKIYKPPPSYYKNINLDDMKNNFLEEGKFIYDVFSYIMRDWSIELKKEREESYNIIINEVLKFFPFSCDKSINYKFLIPGAGLNRLGYELFKYGFDIEANDFLFLNGIFTDYIFNHSKKNDLFLYPNIDSSSNFLYEEDVFKKYKFPDIDIDLKNNKYNGKFKFTIGDFFLLYKDSKEESFDCIITSFFIDTAQNIIGYIDNIYKLLKKGGIWINLGSLSYLWSKYPEFTSIELPYDKLKEVICNYGFTFIKEEFKDCSFGYIHNYMRNDIFKCIFFIVRK